jgi:hypothetical protein
MLVVVCCVVLCCVLWFEQFSYHSGNKTILAKSKRPAFAHSYHKICAPRPQILIRHHNPHHLKILHYFYLLVQHSVSCVMGAQKVC